MRRLTLLRHAKAEPPGTGPDHERELAMRGREQCTVVAQRLREHGRLPQVVLCSSAVRTRQTWDLVVARLPEAPVQVRFLDDLYGGGVADVIGALAGVVDERTEVLVVGHEPTMSTTAARLAGPGSDAAAVAQAQAGMPTAALSFLQTDRSWADLAPAAATLTAVETPGS